MPIAVMLLGWWLAGQSAPPPATPPAAAPVQVAGAWLLSTEVQGSTGSPTCTFKQEGATLSGSCEGPGGTEQPAKGEVAEKKVTFSYDILWEGSPLTLTFTGTLESESEMKGAVDVQPVNVGGVFTAKRKAQ